jgi:probable HAF family extracellular repeat protein
MLSPAAGQAPEYDVLDIGTLGGPSANALGINNAGQVVGEADTSAELRHPFIWEAEVMTDLGTFNDGRVGSAWALNELGQVVGFSEIAAFDDWHAFLWDGGVMTDVGTLGGDESEAYGINELGQVVGFSGIAASSDWHAFLWQSGVMTDLGTLGGTHSQAFAINDAGQVVGRAFTGSAEHAFLWDSDGMTDLGTLGGEQSGAWDLNESGQVVGSAQIASFISHAFRWEGGTMTDLAPQGDTRFSTATAINEAGHVVGDVVEELTQFAFLWRNGKMLDLNNLIPVDSGWLLLRANDINDSGQIVGYGVREGFAGFRAFLLKSCAPQHVTGLRAERLPDGRIEFTWDGLAEAGSYDLIGDALPVGDVSSAPCRTSEDGNVTDTAFADAFLPPAGSGEWLLVRGVNEACAVAGTWDTAGDEDRANGSCD